MVWLYYFHSFVERLQAAADSNSTRKNGRYKADRQGHHGEAPEGRLGPVSLSFVAVGLTGPVQDTGDERCCLRWPQMLHHSTQNAKEAEARRWRPHSTVYILFILSLRKYKGHYKKKLCFVAFLNRPTSLWWCISLYKWHIPQNTVLSSQQHLKAFAIASGLPESNFNSSVSCIRTGCRV